VPATLRVIAVEVVSVLLALATVLAIPFTAGAADAAGDGPDQSIQIRFNRACDLYESGDFASAGAALEAIRSAGIRSAAVHYNLANSYYKQGQMGRAVANYRRALMLSPRDADARANLDLIRTAVGAGDTTAAVGASRAAGFPARLVSPKQLQVLFYVAYYLAAGFFIGALFFRGPMRRMAVYGLVIAVVGAGLALALSRYGLSRIRSSADAVVVADRAGLKSGPGPAFDEVSALPDGLELRQRARSGIWVEVELPTGEIGWVRGEDIETI
jgi:tetratricopeptide (TPR) repeat protein